MNDNNCKKTYNNLRLRENMENKQNPHRNKKWLISYLIGVLGGIVLGIFAAELFGEDHSPYRVQIWAGLFGFIGAGVGLLINLICLTFSRKRGKGSREKKRG